MSTVRTSTVRDSGALDVSSCTFGQFLDAAEHRFGDLDALVALQQDEGGVSTVRMTYRQLASEVRALQAALEAEGIRPGDRVAVLLSSVPAWILVLFAVTRLGAVFVPVSTRFGSHEIRHVLEHSGSVALVATGRYLNIDFAAAVAETVGAGWRSGGGGDLPALKRIFGVGSPPHPDAIDVAALLARGHAAVAAGALPAASVDPDAPAIQFYTSGTTAAPKAVALSHRNLLPHSVGCGALIGLQPGERVLTLYPFFGISGGANKVLSTLGCGACLVFQDTFRAREALELLDRERCTVLHALDIHLRELVPIARARSEPPPERRGSFAFMAGIDPELARDAGRWLGLNAFVHPYGMTETNPMVLRCDLDDPFECRVRPGGRAAPGVEVRVVDGATGAPVPAGGTGEIEARGITVMRGYVRDPDATAAAFRDGWFRTGDHGTLTEDGFVFYVGRARDMLKVGGFNVAPQEVEAYLRTLDGVADVAVTGVADPRLGEVVMAFIVPQAGATFDLASVRERCRGRIANYKIPARIRLVDRLPYHTAAHGAKLQRHVLKAWATTETS